jgi:hypothetical protein
VKRLACIGLVVVVAALALAPRPARADDDDKVRTRKFGFAERGKSLTVSVSFTDVFTLGLLENLDSGFETTLVIRAYVYPDKTGALPVAFTAATVRIVYDLWGEVYLVRIVDGRGTREVAVPTRAEVLKRATVLTEFPVAPLSKVPTGEIHFIGLIVEVNPVSEELLAEVRRWLARDAGAAKVDEGSSFFGSFVSIFVNPKIPIADRVLKLRSQPFYRVKR